MNNTEKIVRTINGTYTPRVEEIFKLYSYARMNRMGYYFLYILDKRKMLPEKLGEKYVLEERKYYGIIDAMIRLTENLDEAGIGYAIFKSIRPYPSTTVDIDTIIFEKYREAYIWLRKKGYIKLGYGPETITLLDPSKTVGIDLYREIAVSRIIYLEKEKLKPYIVRRKILDEEVQTLKPEADLVAIASHIIVKEQIYTLADYYTITKHLKNIDMEKLWSIAEKTNSIKTLSTILTITNKIYNKTLPIKINPTQILIEKIRNPRTRRSLAYQTTYTIKHSKKFIQELIKHVERKTY